MISLVGLSPTLLMWIAGGGALLISMLYLLRLRRRRVVVPYLPLWQRVVKQSQYQSLWQRLKRLLSWLIQIALLLLLVFSLGDPKLRAELLSGRQVVVIVDASASMQATDLGKSRLQLAKEKALELIDGMVGEDRIMLVQMDAEVLPLTPFTTDKRLLREKLKGLKSSETAANLRRALLLAKDALQDRKRGEIIVLSDAAFGAQYESLLVPLARPPKKRPKKTKKPKKRGKKPVRKRDDPGSDVPKKGKKGKKGKKLRKKKKRKKKRKRRRRKRRKAKKKKKKRKLIKLPPGLKRRIDVTQFTRISSVHRKLPKFQLFRFGKMSENVGIVALSARRLTNHPMQFAVYTELRNFGKKPVSGLLEFYVDKLIVETITVKLKAGEHLRHILPRLTAQGQKLEARLKITKGLDLLPADNRAYAVLPKAQPISVLLVSADNLYLQAALLSDAQLIYKHINCGADIPAGKSFDVIIYNECAPKEMPDKGRFFFVAPPAKNSPIKVRMRGKKPQYIKGPIVTEMSRDHPMLRFVALRDLNVSRTLSFQLGRGDRAIASSFGKPLVVVKETKTMRAAALGFSLSETDMTLRVAFPLFLRNTIQWLMRGGRPLPPTARRTGKIWSILLTAGSKEVEIQDPQGRKVSLPVNDDTVLFSGKFSGFYKLSFAGGQRLIAANLSDPGESKIRPRKVKPQRTRVGPKIDEKDDKTGIKIMGMRLPIPKPIWLYLLLLVVLIMGLEWYTYNRRITV